MKSIVVDHPEQPWVSSELLGLVDKSSVSMDCERGHHMA